MPKFTVSAVNNAPVDGTNATYSASVTGLVGVAGDILVINPSAAALSSGAQPQKIIRITQITFSGTATAASDLALSVIMRSTADTAGTVVASTPLDSRDGPATAVVQSYTAAPTPGTQIGTPIRVANYYANTTAAALATVQYWDFGTGPKRCPTLWLPAQTLAINIGATLTGAAYNIDIGWTEEPFN